MGTPSGWSLIAIAQGSGPEARAALGALIGRHEKSVMALMRWRRFPPDQTEEDLKQAFFARMVERNDVMRLDRDRGCFRPWLKTAVQRFLFNDWKRWYSKPGNEKEPLDEDVAAVEAAPYDVFDVAYAWETFRPVFDALRAEQRNLLRFNALQRYLFGPQLDVVEYGPVAASIGISRTLAAATVCHLRQRLKELLTAVVAETLDIDASTPAGQKAITIEVALVCRIVSETPEPT